MKQLIATLRQRVAYFGFGGLQNLLAIGGAAAVSHGVGRIYAPAGEIVAGLFAIGLAWLLSRVV